MATTLPLVPTSKLPLDVIEHWGIELDELNASLEGLWSRLVERVDAVSKSSKLTTEGKQSELVALGLETVAKAANLAAPVLRRTTTALENAEREAGGLRSIDLGQLARLEGVENIWNSPAARQFQYVQLLTEARARLTDPARDPLHVRAELDGSIIEGDPWPLAAVTSLPGTRGAAFLRSIGAPDLATLTARFWTKRDPESAALVERHKRAMGAAAYAANLTAQRAWAATGATPEPESIPQIRAALKRSSD